MRHKQRYAYTVTHRRFVRIALIMTSALIAVIVITCALYTAVILERNRGYVEGVMNQYRDSLDAQLEEYAQLVQTAAYDPSVRDYLLAEDAYERHLAGLRVSTLFSNLKMVRNGIEDFFVFRPDDAQITYVRLGAEQPALMRRLWQCKKPEIIGIFPYASTYGQPCDADFVTILGCPVYSLSGDEQHTSVTGAVAVAIGRQALEHNLREFYQLDGIHYSLMDRSRSVILGERLPVTAQDYRLASDGSTVTRDTVSTSLMLSGIPAMNAVLAVQTDKQVLLKDLFTITLVVLLMAVGLLGVLLRMFGRISSEITIPLANLTEAVKHMDADPTHRRHVSEEGNADFRMLSASLNRMLKTETRLTCELLEANRSLYESELAKKHLELQFLRSQINPHFLYNTLETIRSIALVYKVPEAASAAKNLAKLLRYSIKGGEIMPLASELEIIRCYLSIQELRFGARIQTVFHIDETVEGLYIPRMCLQPLVENAVVHGLETSIGPGVLTLSGWKDTQSLWVSIEDTGVGIGSEELERINRQLAAPFSEEAEQRGGIGMLNVARRLQLSLGNDFVMQVSSKLNQGTVVTLRMPLCKLEQTGGGARV